MTYGSGVVPEKFLQAQLGALEDLGQRGTLHLAGVVGHGEVDRRVSRMGGEVVATLDAVKDVSGVLECANDLPRFERGNARRHAPLDDDRHALGDGAPESGSSLAGNSLSTLP